VSPGGANVAFRHAAEVAAAVGASGTSPRPRDQEAAAPTKQAAIANANASGRPLRNGPAIKCVEPPRPRERADGERTRRRRTRAAAIDGAHARRARGRAARQSPPPIRATEGSRSSSWPLTAARRWPRTGGAAKAGSRGRSRASWPLTSCARSATPEVVDRFRAELKRQGVGGTVERLPGTSQGFAMADLPVYDRDAAERHFERTLDLWRRNLS